MITADDVEDLLRLLTDKFEAFCADNKLPPKEVQELLLRDDLTDEQRRCLCAFSHRWETVEDLHDVLHYLGEP
jgi:hypothetical protein